jgi:hypothetical protein
MLISGRCHCGNLSFRLDWTPEPAEIPARACGCSFCAKHGGVWTSCPTGSLEVRVREPAAVSRYTFGTGTADFHVCARCGVVPVVTRRVEGRLRAVVSVNAFEGVDPARLRVVPVSFEGESAADRLDRRARHWVPDVVFVEGA